MGIRGLCFKVEIISNGIAKTELVILAFLYCREFMKNSIESNRSRVKLNYIRLHKLTQINPP